MRSYALKLMERANRSRLKSVHAICPLSSNDPGRHVPPDLSWLNAELQEPKNRTSCRHSSKTFGMESNCVHVAS